MIAVVVSGLAYDTKHLRFATTSIGIGCADGNDIVLDGKPVAPRHARISIVDGTYYVEDLGSASGTFLNYRRLTAPAIIRFDDRLRIGNHMLQLARTGAAAVEAPEPVEEKLLQAIESGDDGSRLAYADWLEQRGDQLRAELVRRQDELAQRGESTNDIVMQLTRSTDSDWRRRISRAPIEQCGMQWRFQCPRQWSSLALTADPAVRYCGACQRNVHYCTTLAVAAAVAERGDCVAIDAAVRRGADDLGYRRCGTCETVVGYRARACPRCGEALTIDELADVEMGELASPED